MSDCNVVRHMIKYVEEKEKEFISESYNEPYKRTEIVNSIIKELEQELADEDK